MNLPEIPIPDAFKEIRTKTKTKGLITKTKTTAVFADEKVWGLYSGHHVNPHENVAIALEIARKQCIEREGDPRLVQAGYEVDRTNGPELSISCSGNCLGCWVTQQAMRATGEQLDAILKQPVEKRVPHMKLPKAILWLGERLEPN